MNNNEQLKILAAAIYEIRTLLSPYLGSQDNAKPEIRLAAHLSYALHNESQRIIEGKDINNLESVIEKLKAAEGIVGATYIDSFGALGLRKK